MKAYKLETGYSEKEKYCDDLYKIVETEAYIE